MKLISEKELAQLLLDSAELKALEEAGVDNWIGYEYADETDNGEYFQELSEMSDEEITKNYKDA